MEREILGKRKTWVALGLGKTLLLIGARVLENAAPGLSELKFKV